MINCDYLDVYGKIFEFAKWRFHNRNYKIKMFDVLKGWPQDKYQAVIAYDVLEHLQDMEETVKRIAVILEIKGFFLNKSTFSEKGSI
jgi:2-polyprenyl-3-methyl-5-hydroxy-6-metoxy-1,4-benzoquinol methylase